ncbi:hypothetical protein NQ317_001908 [Molorchus minor]|uniref:Resolvase HTH domain-containing protein n=1 Tax=Molorchus minor TaxID=1323400 RepID=A0ABQ9JFA8_9CUCU|nr:hypothetical protein NQ317_001908 [Molorchus minor]
MLLMYGECKPQRQLVATQDVFPIDFIPPRGDLSVTQRARDTGQIQEHGGQHAGRARRHHMLQTKEEVKDIVEDYPSTSTREIARQVNVSQQKVWKTLRENQ